MDLPIEKIGFDPWFLDSIDPEKQAGLKIARVTAVHKERYTINDGQDDVLAELVGKIVYSAASPLDLPTVGDWVLANFYDEKSWALIHQILPRKSLLKRKTPGKKVDLQLIAANIDTAFIVQSLDGNFNLRRLERYLVMVHQSNIRPVVLLSKSDLLSSERIAAKAAEVCDLMPDLEVVPFSNQKASDFACVTHLLQAGKTYCLLGSSGVGKTTLLNNLHGELDFKTKAVRQKDGKGRHATTSRQLIKLGGGALMVDTPGMRELGNLFVETGLDETFADIAALADNCRFHDCRHETEKGCAVLQAVKAGRLSQQRYLNYIKMGKETRFNEMSYREKRLKDKQFGKMVKAVMKHKKNKR